MSDCPLSRYVFKDFRSLYSVPDTICVRICISLTLLSVLVAFLELIMSSLIDIIFVVVLVICNGYSDMVFSSISSMYLFTPCDSDKIMAMPMIPIEPAKDTRIVRAFLVFKLLKLRDSAVKNDIEDLPMFLCTGSGASPSGISYGSESSRSLPSFTLTIRVAY